MVEHSAWMAWISVWSVEDLESSTMLSNRRGWIANVSSGGAVLIGGDVLLKCYWCCRMVIGNHL